MEFVVTIHGLNIFPKSFVVDSETKKEAIEKAIEHNSELDLIPDKKISMIEVCRKKHTPACKCKRCNIPTGKLTCKKDCVLWEPLVTPLFTVKGREIGICSKDGKAREENSFCSDFIFPNE